MHLLKSTAVFLLLGAGLFAYADQASVDRDRKDLDRKESRELQKIDQAEEQEHIKFRSRERDELAKIQRDLNSSAATATATVVATGTMSTLDTAKLAQYKFLQDEVSNLIQNQLTAEASARFTHDRSAINRKYTLERAKLDAQQIDAGDATAKQRDTALKTADITAKYQEQLDDLAQEEALANAKERFEQTTKINAGERDLSAFASKQLMAQMGKANATPYNPTADPEYNKLAAVRDEARNALETSLDELRAKFNVKRTDINNARDDDLAKLSSS
ncbi:MAG TPA: hypothetical protein VGM64_02120 [Lacunisphaera sp.]|jgi:hypothetical protein